MRRYETLFLVNPELSDDALNEVARKFKEIISSHQGHVLKYDEWGKRRLAYLVKKNDYALYVLLDYCGSSEIVAELERNMRFDERVLKFITVKLAHFVKPEEFEKLKAEFTPDTEIPSKEVTDIEVKESIPESEIQEAEIREEKVEEIEKKSLGEESEGESSE